MAFLVNILEYNYVFDKFNLEGIVTFCSTIILELSLTLYMGLPLF